MRTLVLYESMFGNTEAVARSIAEGLRLSGTCETSSVDALRPGALAEIDLLVVGAPTQAWGLPRARTWYSPTALQAKAAPRPEGFLRDELAAIVEGRGRAAAAFATRLDRPRALTGSAARGISRRLRRRGWVLVDRPMSFVVTGTDGPLRAGEIERARAWGESLGRAVAQAPTVTT
jgi:hypothetical protein